LSARRLAPDVRPHEVDLHVEVDPARDDRFAGEVRIALELARPRRTLELNAADLRVGEARLEHAGATLRGRVTPRPERESIEIAFEHPLPAGSAILSLRFRGRLRRDLRGLYAARSGARRYAFTQLEAADARRFFPCFDEPAMKARFRVAVTTGAGNAVLSNAPVARVEERPDGRKHVVFEATPPLSTYLVALAVGELEASEPVWLGETPIRVWHVPGKGALTDFALETARETLARLERYFALPYPYAKLDLVAVPDFEAGAMENAGAVFFRETLLLVDPGTVTLQERKRVAEVVCHELAHMWYGDLVTMAWWNDLWLNEAFATWMAFAVVDDWKPEWKMWHDFQHHRAAALALDALSTTHPIYAEVRSPAEATENFDLITYEKGASVVRMLERYLGPAAFRKGVRAYIRRHREANAEAADLWRALSEASGEDVEPLARAWIEQPGFPLLALRRRERGSRQVLELRQERFVARPSRRGARKPAGRWPIPWVGRVGEGGKRATSLERRLLVRAKEELALPGKPDFVYGNADEGGFFRPLHDAAELERLARHLPRLAAAERMGLVGHQFALMRAGRAPIEGFLELAAALDRERDPDVLVELRGGLGFVAEQIAPAAGPDVEAAFRAFVVARFAPAFAALGWDPAQDETDETRLRRAVLLSLMGELAEVEPVQREARERCRAYLANRSSLEPNLADSVVALAAREGDGELFDALLGAAEKARTPQERRRFLLAVGEFRDPRLQDAALRAALTDTVPTQDVAFLLARMLGNRFARERAWTFVKRRWAALRRRMPPMLATRLVEATSALQTPAYRKQVAEFFSRNPLPTAKRALRQTLERFTLNAEVRRREAPGLRRWLEQTASLKQPGSASSRRTSGGPARGRGGPRRSAP
jgi:puromycin-sensitive aminopeptidase